MKSSTRPTKIGAEKNFLTKAEDFLEGSRKAVNDHSNAAATLAVHTVISACDAISQNSCNASTPVRIICKQ